MTRTKTERCIECDVEHHISWMVDNGLCRICDYPYAPDLADDMRARIMYAADNDRVITDDDKLLEYGTVMAKICEKYTLAENEDKGIDHVEKVRRVKA